MTTVEVNADLACPLAHAGIRAVHTRRDQLGCDVLRLRIRAWPLELVNGDPLDPAVVVEEGEALRAHVGPNLFAGFDPGRFPFSTLPAPALAAAAYRHDLDTGERVSLALRDPVFEEGRHISVPAVLNAIGDTHQVGPVTDGDSAAVLADWNAGQRHGVEGSPHVFCGPASAFCPSLEVCKDGGGHLHVRADAARLDAFLASCLAR